MSEVQFETPPHGGQYGEGYGRAKVQGADFSHGIALYLENVSVWFDSFRALNDLSLYINEGELRCIIGPNGAGKTTLMDVITGKTRPTQGTAFFGQNYNLAKMTTEQIAEAGIGRKFQKPTVFENFSVMENLLLAAPKDKTVKRSFFAKLTSETQVALEQTLEQIRLKDFRHKTAGLLSHGQKQWLEIGMLLMQQPKLILLDEPVAGMTDAETERTAELCLELKKQHTLIVVEHDMSFIDTISEKVTVLAQGAILAEGTLAEVQANEDVIEKYLGR
ncbi:urea ABC transporter ATP-binding protein UrtD [Acinetobacter soli]|uniref:urea ABC transporter ATP-binding protein UrtD n=1 Tax=Acinetobacter soli TaxID=487316 RepID=UPI000CE3241F|nr:urea ABC transporter ATP-binding protein UrtD [Acinetobacter soli]PPB85940.1 urea ABC transporter ATP-binding protein UrtD [Acinetobacter soli]WEI14101.1 urea ABC transporter ATP-binding protein UrtD [Acinetobacter soli]WEI15752.1 urea ABC transporter ATP-binding protein UrtD [Acinetobacter soli]